MARLDQICSLNMGQSPDSSSYNENGEGMPFFQGNADFGKVHPRVRVWCSAPTKVAHTGDVLISVRAPIGALNIADRECCIGRGLAALTVNEELCNKDYLWYAIASKVEELNSKGTGSTFKAISKSVLAETEIPLPTLGEQQGVARQLEKVDELITLRKEQLSKLDELVKSRFIELFGDQETNPYNLNVGKLSDVSEIYLGLTHTPTYVEQGRPFLSVRDISSGVIDFSNCHYVTEEEFGSLPNGARPKVGDMLFCRVGTIGKPVIIPENTPEFGTFVSVGYLRKKENVNNYYLKSWMENDCFMRQVYDNVAGASQINLNTGWLKNFRILIPSLELQEQFAAFVEQTDKSKLAIQQSLEKLETLKKALMQKYFG